MGIIPNDPDGFVELHPRPNSNTDTYTYRSAGLNLEPVPLLFKISRPDSGSIHKKRTQHKSIKMNRNHDLGRFVGVESRRPTNRPKTTESIQINRLSKHKSIHKKPNRSKEIHFRPTSRPQKGKIDSPVVPRGILRSSKCIF